MTDNARRSVFARLPVLGSIGVCLFFVLFFLFIRHRVNPQLLYHGDKLTLSSGKVIEFPIFRKGEAFVDEFVDKPGGLSEYIAAMLCQYYYYSFLGPLVLTALALVLYLLTGGIIRLCGWPNAWPLLFVPPLLLLIAYNRYDAVLCNYVAITAALAGVSVYLYVARSARAIVRLVVFAIGSACLYYVAGGAYMLFAVLCASFELLAGRRYSLGGLYVVSAALVPLGGVRVFGCGLNEAYFGVSGLSPFDGSAGVIVLWGLYVFFLLVALALPFRRVFARLGGGVRISRLKGIAGVCGVAVVAIASLAVALFTADTEAHRVLRANYLARMERWPELLDEVAVNDNEEYPPSVMLDVNRALFETGQMGDRMFSYKQHPSVLMELGSRAVSYKGACDLLLRLGRVNEAEHAALEDLEINGPRPETLGRLAIVYMVKGQPAAARVFLTILSRDIVAGQWAADTLRRLEDDPQMASDEDIRRLRSIMPLHDRIITSPKSYSVASDVVNPKEAIFL